MPGCGWQSSIQNILTVNITVGCVGCVLILPLVHLLLTSPWHCVETHLLEELRQSTQQPGPEASPTRISHTANKPVKWQQSPVQQVSKINLLYFWKRGHSCEWVRCGTGDILNGSGMAKSDAEWLWCGITIIRNNSAFSGWLQRKIEDRD